MKDKLDSDSESRRYWPLVFFCGAVLALPAVGFLYRHLPFDVATDFVRFVLGALVVGILGWIYFLPTMIGWHKRNAAGILVLNLFLGWTFIGWLGALVWAATLDREG